MKRPLRATLLMVVGFCLLLSGCTGMFTTQKKVEDFGSIVGQVVDAADQGIPNAQVRVEGTNIVGITDAQGRFSFPQVPVGPQRIVVEAAPQLSPMQTLDISSATLQVDGDEQPVLMIDNNTVSWATLFNVPQHAATLDVVVKANQPLQITIRVPLYEGLDSVTLVSATPKLGETLQADSLPEFAFDVSYSLQSAQNGRVLLYLFVEQSDGEMELIKEFSASTQRSAGNIRFSGQLSRDIGGQHLRLMLALVDQSGNVLAINTVAGYPLEGGPIPYTPTLELAEFNAGQFVFTWSGGNPADFVAYDLLRGITGHSIYSMSTIATTTDPNATFLVDASPWEGRTVDYRLRLRTQNSGDLLSNVVTLEIPNFGVETLFSAAPQIGDIIHDPVRDILYATDVERNEIVLISTDTYVVVERIPVGSRPMRLAITADGTTLLATNTGSESISVVNLMTGSVSFIKGIRAPYGIAVDSSRDRLYYSSGYENTTIRSVKLSTGELIAEAPAPMGYHLALSPDGSRLLVTPDNVYFDTILFDTEDLSVLGSERLRLPDYPTPQFSLARGEWYFGEEIYDGNDLTYLDNLNHTIADLPYGKLNVQAISADEQRLYAIYTGTGATTRFYVLEQKDGRWETAFHFPLLRDYVMKTVLSRDGSKAYLLVRSSPAVLVIDLELREAMAPSS